MNTFDITLITPTGARPLAFELCALHMQSQTGLENQTVQWIIVDDAEPVTSQEIGSPPFTETQWLYPKPAWQRGQNTQARNLREAIPQVRGRKVMIIEDDDAYLPHHVATMSKLLDTYDFAGQDTTYYYNIFSKQYNIFYHPGRSSLFSTAFRAEHLSILQNESIDGRDFIDIDLWRIAKAKQLSMGFCAPTGVGIKGLPGREGIGIGHRPPSHWDRDHNNMAMRRWLNDEMIARYDAVLAAGRRR